jgi:hypothetical protein
VVAGQVVEGGSGAGLQTSTVVPLSVVVVELEESATCGGAPARTIRTATPIRCL